MCGISLFVSDKEISLDLSIKQMVRSMNHRGPDNQGIYIDKKQNIALGHNRLSIIDLSNHANQPMISADQNLILVFNGEIYNFPKLREELRLLGYRFKSHSDTEVILYGFKEWGTQIFQKLNGMWGIVIYDRSKKKIYVSRDRVGIKPVYYCFDGKNFIVASEIKGILASDQVRAEVNLEGLNEYFSFQNILSSQTLFKNIYMLEPGHNIEFDITEFKLKISRYWDIDYKNKAILKTEDFCNEILYNFKESCKLTLLSDVPIGATISGGMDSSAIIASLQEASFSLNTFTGYFDHSNIDLHDRSVNESDDARIISQLFNSKHHEKLISSGDVITTLPAIIWHLEDPKVGMCYTFYLMSQIVSQYATVNLSGTGGDEIFGGYPWRYKQIEGIKSHNEFSNIYYRNWCRLVQDNQKKEFFTNNVLNKIDLDSPRNSFDNIIKNQKNLDSINLALYFELKTFLHGMLLVEDKMGMAFSIETRFPFLTNEMLDISSIIPGNLKYNNNEAKLLLKLAFKDLLPKELIYKRKQGFTPPDMSWYRSSLKKYIYQMLLGPRSMIGDYVSLDYIKTVLERHQQGEDNRLLIWSLLFFEGWLRIFIANQGKGLRFF